jgi:hypothetical protein
VTGMNYAELQQAIREASGHLLSDTQVLEITRLATGWAEASALERTRRLADEHRRHSVALDAHKARADAAESRAIHAERQLARFADGILRFEELAERAEKGQRDADLVDELRRRIAGLERRNAQLLADALGTGSTK